MENINLLGDAEQGLRLEKLKVLMRAEGLHQAVLRNNSNIYWLTGRVFRGFVFIDVGLDFPRYFLRQPSHLKSEHEGLVSVIRKPEDILPILVEEGIVVSGVPALELDTDSYSLSVRLATAFGGSPNLNISPLIRRARSVKTPVEQDMLRISGQKQTRVYERIPHYYREGMTDIEFQIEIERASRLEGCLGQFRIYGDDMELFMGNVLTGDNADTPSPYDFAMGGEGLDPSIPVGANGTVIRPNAPVMVDVNGNYTGYMTDMTRMYIAGDIPSEAQRAIDLSIAICKELQNNMIPGVHASELFSQALAIAEQGGMKEYFMGHRSHAGFVGHGLGIEINEMPVIAPRSRDVLEEGNAVALEPKFVIPGLGAIGIENTYIVRSAAPAECITNAPTGFIKLV